ncbi:unnamed protein product [marine sediment metagenome]|uniref:Uncharacterized protein n=1 Tax=marine sediment metagenome TaxID=412755 RepID=X1V5K2_9ZZZZ
MIIYSLFFSSVYDVLIVFWAESAVIAFYNILKLATAGWEHTQTMFAGIPFGAGIMLVVRLGMIVFFLVHFSLFMFAHLFMGFKDTALLDEVDQAVTIFLTEVIPTGRFQGWLPEVYLRLSHSQGEE